MMRKKYALLGFFLSAVLFIQAQTNFSFSPRQPKPGDKIVFNYTAPSDIFNTTDSINCEAFKWSYYFDEYVTWSGTPGRPVSVTLKKTGNHYEGAVQTDTLTQMLSFSFTSGNIEFGFGSDGPVIEKGKVDHNNQSGYCIQFYTAEGKPCRYSNFLSGKYLRGINDLGINNAGKANEFLLKEMELFPDAKYYTLPMASMISKPNLPESEKIRGVALKEMDNLFAQGLTTEKDINLMVALSRTLNLRGQATYFGNFAKEKMDEGGETDSIYASADEYNNENDIAKKETIVNKMISFYNKLGVEEKTKYYVLIHSFRFKFVTDLVLAGRYNELKSNTEKLQISKEDNPYDYRSYKAMIETLMDEHPEQAQKIALENFSFYADRVSKTNAGIVLPSTKFDIYKTKAEKKANDVEASYKFADMLSQFFLKAGQDKKAFEYVQQAQHYMQIQNTLPPDAINTNMRYMALAEKFLSSKKYRQAVENMIETNHYNQEIFDEVKRLYIKQKKSEEGFDEYLLTLKKLNLEVLQQKLMAMKTNIVAPSLILNDLDGNLVTIADLKGKTIILDFWATWCSLCIASFPGMQKLVTGYKDNPNVKFLFVNTSERYKTDEEKKAAAAKVIAQKNYSFQVLLDYNGKVSQDFGIGNLPTKIIIDKEGNIRYKVAGFESSMDKALDEINAMIDSVK